jgi:hypothetical protein
VLVCLWADTCRHVISKGNRRSEDATVGPGCMQSYQGGSLKHELVTKPTS